MKIYIAKILSILLIFVFTYQYLQFFNKQSIRETIKQSENWIQKNHIKKVSYGEGEYEKVSKKWKKTLTELFDHVSKNMNIQLEQIVVQNYIEYSKQYKKLWEDIVNVEPPKKYKDIHDGIFLETTTGLKLCDSYLNNINRFDEYFRSLFVYHYKNRNSIIK